MDLISDLLGKLDKNNEEKKNTKLKDEMIEFNYCVQFNFYFTLKHSIATNYCPQQKNSLT